MLNYIGFQNYIDLNDYACPKFDNLVLNSFLTNIVNEHEVLLSFKYRCNRHYPLKDSTMTAHCPALETAYFMAWYKYINNPMFNFNE